MESVLRLTPASHSQGGDPVERLVRDEQKATPSPADEAYPSDPLLHNPGALSRQCSVPQAASYEPLVSGAGHDALALAEVTKVRACSRVKHVGLRM